MHGEWKKLTRDSVSPPASAPSPAPSPAISPSPAPASSPALAPSPAPSRLQRTLHSLRSPFRSGSPFHIGSIKRSGSTKSAASDGDIARGERTMRKKIKKQRADASSDASRSTDSSPTVDKKKKESGGFMRRMGTIGKKRAEESSPTPPQVDSSPSTSQVDEYSYPPPQSLQVDNAISTHPTELEVPQINEVIPPQSELKEESPPTSQIHEDAPKTQLNTMKTQPQQSDVSKPDSDVVINKSNAPENANNAYQVPLPLTPSPEPIVSPIAVEHAVATRPFTKDAWKRKTKRPEIPRPVEEPSPGNALKRRIAFVSQTSACLSEDHDDDDDDDDDDDEVVGKVGGGDEVGSLEEAVTLARARLTGGPTSPSPPHSHSRDNDETEEEGSADTMPAYGDLIEPDNKAGNGSGPSHATPSAERREHLYKILVIGELGTGKTSIIKRYVHQFFSQHYRATIGVDFALKVLNWDSNTIIRLQLWDIAGQERFGNMTRVYYKEAVGAFIVFDVSRVATFDAVVKWKNDLDTKVQLPDGSPIPCILLANKCDQQKEGIVNSAAKMEEYCREKGFAGWFETSAKENINIEEAARSLVNKILLNDKLLHNNDKDGERFALDHKIANGENSRNSGGGKSCAC